MARKDGRRFDELRPVRITRGFVKYPLGSVLVEFGDTRVICAASSQDIQPRWMRDQGISGGWVTSEYSMLPFSSPERSVRDATRGRIGGRTYEIQRMIGRALRAVVDLKKIGERTLWIDCDVIQADGGTRTAAITGAYVAMSLAVGKLMDEGKIDADPISEPLAAVSVGRVENEIILDLNYDEDCRAGVDLNVVMTGSERFIEIQGTAESNPFSNEDLSKMLDLARRGIKELIFIQKSVLAEK